MEKISVKIIKQNDGIRIPKQSTDDSAGYDLFAPADYVIPPGAGKMISLEFGIEIENPGICGKIYCRSGLARQGILISGAPTIIDRDFQGVIRVFIRNHTKKRYKIRCGNRIAQMVFERYFSAEWIEAEEFNRTSTRGKGGFGSTGK